MLERVVRGVQSCVADAQDAARAEQQADRVALLQVVQLTQRWATEKFGEQDQVLQSMRHDMQELSQEVTALRSERSDLSQELAALRSERSEMMAAITAQAAQIMALRDTVASLVERASEPAQVQQQPIPAHTRRALFDNLPSAPPMATSMQLPPRSASHQAACAAAHDAHGGNTRARPGTRLPNVSVSPPSTPPRRDDAPPPAVSAAGSMQPVYGAASYTVSQVGGDSGGRSPIRLMQSHVEALASAVAEAQVAGGTRAVGAAAAAQASLPLDDHMDMESKAQPALRMMEPVSASSKVAPERKTPSREPQWSGREVQHGSSDDTGGTTGGCEQSPVQSNRQTSPAASQRGVPAGGAKGSPTISREERMAQLEQELNAGRSTSGGGGPTPRTQDE